jgi:ribonuclease P protein component
MPRRQPAVEAMARLVTSADFERVLRAGSRARTPHFAVHHLGAMVGAAQSVAMEPTNQELSTDVALAGASPVDESPKKHLGVVVPKRHARRAVTRTLLKRQIYAAGDRHAATLDVGMWVVRLRAPFDRAIFPSAASEALRLLARSELETLFRAVARPAAP